MNRGRLVGWLVVVAVVVVAILVSTLGFGARPRLGLDLRGGISVILTPQLAEGEGEVPSDVIDETIEIIRSRIDALGVAEPEIARQGDDILVQLPGIEDRERALSVIGRTARLAFRPVVATIPPTDPRYAEAGPDCIENEDEVIAGLLESQPTPVPTEPTSPAPTEAADESPEPDVLSTPSGDPAVDESPQSHGDVPVTAAAAQTPTEAPSPTDTAATEAPTDAPTEAGTDAPTEAPSPAEGETEIVCGETSEDDETTPEDEAALPPLKYVVGPPALTGTAVDDAIATPEPTAAGGVSNNWVVQLDLTNEGADQFAQITSELACLRDQGDPSGGQLGIVLDELVESAPTMSPDVQCGVGITGGRAIITVGGDREEAQDLALVLRTGALPITLEPSTAYNVSATLGAQSLRAGVIAGAIGLLLVAAYLLFFYRWLGLVSIGALAIFGVGIFGIITALGAAGFTLTLAGIAGIIVSIGIAADSGILYFERIRDELESGKTVRTSVVRAFPSAFRTNLTGNTVTIAAAVILYFLAVGPVRGFAFTLGTATALDLLILYAFTRPAVQLLGGTRILTRRSARVATDTATGGS